MSAGTGINYMKAQLLINNTWWRPDLWRQGDKLYEEVAFGEYGKEIYLGVHLPPLDNESPSTFES